MTLKETGWPHGVWGIVRGAQSLRLELGPILCSPLCSCEASSNFFSLPKSFSFSKNENKRPAFQSLDDELCACSIWSWIMLSQKWPFYCYQLAWTFNAAWYLFFIFLNMTSCISVASPMSKLANFKENLQLDKVFYSAYDWIHSFAFFRRQVIYLFGYVESLPWHVVSSIFVVACGV